MPDRSFDPDHFFDHFATFVETSETGPVIDRLNARYLTLIHENRALLEGATVLDLASHDGRFSFAALQNGARRVIGIELEPGLVEKSRANMAHYDVPSDRYEFVNGDLFETIETVEPCDVVFCFGILYHVNDHMALLSRIAESDPRAVIVDTNISQLEPAVIEIRNPVVGSPPPLGGQLEGYPSQAALDAMFASFGWSYTYVDWKHSPLAAAPQMLDYRVGRRVTAVIDCNRQPHSAEQKAAAVAAVFERQRDRQSQWPVIVKVADEIGATRQAVCVWVRKAERAALRNR